MIGKNKRWLFAVIFVIDLLAVFAFYQTRPTYIISLGAAGDSWYIDKFYSPESNTDGAYRWSRDGATATLPAVGTPYQVQLEATAYRPEGASPPSFKLTLSNPNLTASYQGVSQRQTYILSVSGEADFSPGLHTLTINSPTFQPGKTDDRQLGLLVKQITIQARPDSSGLVLPPILAWLSLGLGILLSQVLVLAVCAHKKPLAERRYLITTAVTLILPVGLVALALSMPSLALENAVSVGIGLVALGLTGQSLLKWRLLGPISGAILLSVLVLGIFFNLFNFVALALWCVGSIILAVVISPRMNRTGLNLLIVACTSILPCWGLLQQRFYQTIDGESHHLYWLNELNLMIKEGDFFPHWAPHFSFERGSTVFAFYPPLSRYLAEFFVLGGLTPAFGFLAALVTISVGSGLAMYWLARDFVSGPGAIVAAVGYVYNPYRLADLYQRGDIAEALNFVFFPLSFLAVSRALRINRPVRLPLLVGGGIANGFMLISHQLSAFYFGIFLLIPYCLLGLFRYFWQKRRTPGPALRQVGIRLLWLTGMAGLGVALSAFYILPVILESKNIRVGTKVGIDWGYGFLDENAINWKDWFSWIRPPEYSNRFMTNLAWIGPTSLALALGGLIVLWLPFNRKQAINRWAGLFFGLILIFLLFMQLKFLQPFWETFPGMDYIQFPWRLMIYVALLGSLLNGFLADFLLRAGKLAFLRRPFYSKTRLTRTRPKLRLAFYFSGVVTIFLLSLVLAYTGAGKVSLNYYPPSFSGTYSTGTLINQIENGDVFYLPVWARSLDTIEKESDRAVILRNGQPQNDVVDFKRTESANYQLQVNLSQPGTLVIPVFYFDGWKLTANGRSLPVSYNQPQGYVQANVPAGSYSLDLRFENSLPATVGTTVTILTVLLVIGLLTGRYLFLVKPIRVNLPVPQPVGAMKN